MIGIILYIYFLVIGFLYADMLFKDKDIYFRGWMGGVFGTVIIMSGIMIPSVFFGFTVVSHIILMILAALPICIKWIKNKKIDNISLSGGEYCMDHKIFLLCILPISLIIWILLTNHILAPYDNGAYASGQCTYGDLQMHLGFITSIAEQKEFPPEYNLLAGTVLNYPFFVDMLSSSLYLFGTPLRWAVLIPSYIISLLLVMGFYIAAYSVTKRKSAAIIATVLFFFNGGFGFAYFLNGAKSDHSIFTDMFTEYYKTPTNYNENNIRWSNIICDMIIPQRTTMAGWFMFLPAFWLLTDCLKTKSRKGYIILGVLAGFMPMVHTHSFLALGIISAVLFFVNLYGENNKKEYIINWLIFGGIVAVLAFPQLFYWTFRQTSGNDSFLKWHFNWVNEDDPYLWFYLKNWGIAALFLVPAVLGASKDNKKLLAAGAAIIILAEFIQFQPNEYDNNKLFYIAYMIILMVMGGWLCDIWDALKNVRGKTYLAVVVILAGTLSGVLTICREYNSGAQYQTFSKENIEMADYIKENTPADAVFLTGTEHLNPVCVLAGRTIYVGSSVYVYFHGLGDELSIREKNMKNAYSGSYENMVDFCEKNNIEYVYVGKNEKVNLPLNQQMLDKLEKVYSIGSETLYRVN